MWSSLLARLRAQRFAKSCGLVYFGYVDRQRDDHVLVKGFTLSAKQSDRHYMSGSINGIDTTLIQRTDYLQRSSKNAAPYTWLIGEFHLPIDLGFHALLLSHQHPRSIYEAVFIRLAHYQQITVDPRVNDAFLVYGQNQESEAIKAAMSPQLIQLFVSAPYFDIEIERDRLYVYQATTQITPASLEAILKHGLSICRLFYDASQQ